MSYSNILVAVAVTPESQQLLAKAVSIARPVKGHISLITLASDPEMAMNGVGCRATARIMGVGLNTIFRHLKNSGRSR